MTEQQEYYTFTKDVKTLIQYVQEQVIDHSVVEAANRLNWAIKKDLKNYGIPVTPIKESKDSFEEEKLQYAEDSRTHEKPWKLWQYISSDQSSLEWRTLEKSPKWSKHCVYRRKPTTVVPACYSGLNWKDAEGLIGKIIESTDCPSQGWKIGRLTKIQDGKKGSGIFEVYDREYGTSAMYEYIRTVEEILVPEHPTINIGGVELPMPEPFVLAHGTKYWIFPYPAHRELFRSLQWSYSRSDIDALQAGQVHLTEERAKAWADWWKKEVITKINETVS